MLADDTYEVIGGEVHRRIGLSDPGIDDYRNELLWSPERPTLIDAEVKLCVAREVIDEITVVHRAALDRHATREAPAEWPALQHAAGA